MDPIIDIDCTRCLVNLLTDLKLGIRTKTITRPIQFQQINGLLIGGAPAMFLTESVRLEMSQHWEFIRFVVVPKMTEVVILGLVWLDKWGPTISWGMLQEAKAGKRPRSPPLRGC